jgi:hypothetical protein
MPPRDSVFHASTSERNLIPLAIQSLREKIISVKFFEAEGRVHQMRFAPFTSFLLCWDEVSAPSSMDVLGFSQ